MSESFVSKIPTAQRFGDMLLNMLALSALLVGLARLILRLVQTDSTANDEIHTLTLLAVPIVTVLARSLSKLKIGKDGVEIEIRDAVKATEEKVGEIQGQLATTQAELTGTREQLDMANKKITVLTLVTANGVGGRKQIEVERIGKEALLSNSDAMPTTGTSLTQTEYNDPHRGQFGGKQINNDRRLSADVSAVDAAPGLFKVVLVVSSEKANKELSGTVDFHLHPTFRPARRTVSVQDGKATLELIAWGAFTVGAVADAGMTELELDLASLTNAPREFRDR